LYISANIIIRILYEITLFSWLIPRGGDCSSHESDYRECNSSNCCTSREEGNYPICHLTKYSRSSTVESTYPFSLCGSYWYSVCICRMAVICMWPLGGRRVGAAWGYCRRPGPCSCCAWTESTWRQPLDSSHSTYAWSPGHFSPSLM